MISHTFSIHWAQIFVFLFFLQIEKNANFVILKNS